MCASHYIYRQLLSQYTNIYRYRNAYSLFGKDVYIRLRGIIFAMPSLSDVTSRSESANKNPFAPSRSIHKVLPRARTVQIISMNLPRIPPFPNAVNIGLDLIKGILQIFIVGDGERGWTNRFRVSTGNNISHRVDGVRWKISLLVTGHRAST